MRRSAVTWLLAAALMILGCGGALTAAGDAGDEPDASPDEGVDAAVDAGEEVEDDPVDDPVVDAEPDTVGPECSDGIDNDGDDLIDMEDFDCADPSDDPEGPDSGCSIDNHCAAGWEECDRDTGTCFDPPRGAPCEECTRSEDCGHGVTGDDPDRDFCLISWWPPGVCAKDCAGDFDCPKAFRCVTEGGTLMCRPWSGSCEALGLMGSGCTRDDECGSGGAVVCEGGFCTSTCEVEHDCPTAWSCVSGLCAED